MASLVHSSTRPQPSAVGATGEPQFRKRVWAIQVEVHRRIEEVRENAYRVYPSRESRELQPKQGGGEETPALKARYYNAVSPVAYSDLMTYAALGVSAARDFEEATQKMGVGGSSDAFLATMRAGVLLSYSEKILLAQDELDGTKGSPPALTEVQRISLTSDAMTIVATARDQVAAAEGFVQNRRGEMGSRERTLLLVGWLLPLIVIYLVFDPGFGVSASYLGRLTVPIAFRPFWEVAMWSLFGAIANSLISIQYDVRREEFDPTLVESYLYRIAVAPFVSMTLVAFLSLVGLSSSGITLLIDFESPNYALLVVISFITGFFGKRAIEALDQVWKRTGV